MNYHQYYQTDMLNGPGIRCVLFLSGCNHGCDGCYNESTWNPKSGMAFTKELEDKIIRDLKDERIVRNGITLSGGDPLHERNRDDVLKLILRIREECPGKTIWMWTGYTKDEIMSDKDSRLRYIALNVDTVVDGKFVKALHHPSLQWRGSENQKVWKINRRVEGKPLWEDITPTMDLTDEERAKLHNKIEIKLL